MSFVKGTLHHLAKVKWTPGHFFKQNILSSGHEHIFIHSLGFNTWLIIVFDMLKTAVPTKMAFSCF